jgi:Winged helix-turn helix
MAADGVANEVITDEVGVTPVTVRAWRKQFVVDGLAGLGKIGEGRGRKRRSARDGLRHRQVGHDDDAGRATHWSCPAMAKRVGVSPATVQRI